MAHSHDDHDHDHEHHEGCQHDHDHDHEHEHGDGHGDEGPQVNAVVEALGPCKKLLKVEVPGGEVLKEIEERFRHLSRTVHLKGFRPGRAPRKRIEKLYGKVVRDEARDHLLRAGYVKALREHVGGRKLLGEGTIENVAFSAEDGLRFEVTIHTRPEFELPAYKGLKLTVAPLEVSEADLERALDSLRRRRGEVKKVEGEGAVVEGEDRVTVDVDVWLADEYETWSQNQDAEEGEETSELRPLRSEAGLVVQLPHDRMGQYKVQDLADSLMGLKVGAHGEVETELAPDYEVVEGRGEPAMLHVTVKSIERLFLPELNDEWAKAAGFGSLADLRREVREQLLQQMELGRRHDIEERLLEVLLERVGSFELPGDLLEKEVEQALRRKEIELRVQGKPADAARDEAAGMRDEVRSKVELDLRTFFLLDSIADAEGIEVSEQDLDTRIALIAAREGREPQKLRQELEKHDVLPQLHHELVVERTRTFLREQAQVHEDQDLASAAATS